MTTSLPISLQSAIDTALTQLQQDAGLNDDLLIYIGERFGSLHTLPHQITSQHQRRLLLLLLTLYHLTPFWEYQAPTDTSFRHCIEQMAALVVRRFPQDQAQITIESIWDWCETPRNDNFIQHTLALSLYTLAKIIEPITGIYGFDDYPPDVHANVTLISAAEAYVRFSTHYGRDRAQGYRTFWTYWLTQIVPRAWFAVAEDEAASN